MFGRREMLMVYDVAEAEKIFRREGQFPRREPFETLVHYRNKVRPDIYTDFGSVATEWV